MKATNKIYEAIKLLDSIEMNVQAEQAKQLLKEFIIANDTVKKSDKVDIWKFVYNPKSSVRPVMTGVCYVPSMKVAVGCDSINLLVSKPDYIERETNNGVRINGASEPCGIYRKDGTAVTKELQTSDYPAFLTVIPKEDMQRPAEMTDREKIVNAIKEYKIGKKAKTINHAAIQVASGIWMQPESAELMLSMPEWKFTCDKNSPGSRPVTYRDGNYTAVFMPLMLPSVAGSNEILHIYK